MIKKKTILGICGSASQNSTNLSILKCVGKQFESDFNFEVIASLTELPNFKTELTDKNTPQKIINLRKTIEEADGIIISTPEYVFSVPSCLKNMIEWCVSTTVFSNKPISVITASSSGEKGHEELKLILETIQANLSEETTLLIQGLKGKVDKNGEIIDTTTKAELLKLTKSFKTLISEL